MRVIQGLLTAYAWVIVGVLVVFLWRIAFFYEKTSGRWVGHFLVFVPGALLLAGVARYFLARKPLVGDSLGDLLLFLGGGGIALFGMRLQHLMTGEQS